MKNQQKHNFEMPSAFDSMDAKKPFPFQKVNEKAYTVWAQWTNTVREWKNDEKPRPTNEFNALHANGWHVWCTRLSIAEKEPAY